MQVLTWNLYHGRSQPAAGRPLLVEFAQALAGWDWDVALLQEVPPWWPATLAWAAGADHRAVPTSRNSLPALRRAIATRNPDLIASNGGGANAILVRGPIADHRWIALTRRPERRVAHGVALADGAWVTNLHATKDPKTRSRAAAALALASARGWAGTAPLVLGGDFNLVQPQLEGVELVASHHVDHVFVRGLAVANPALVLDAGRLSDHNPLAVGLDSLEP